MFHLVMLVLKVTKHDESFPRLHSLRWLMVRYLKIGIE